MKWCPKCQTEKPVAEFYKSVNGYHTYCIVCFKVYSKEARDRRGPREPAMEGERRCSRCREVKHVTEFATNRSNTNGRDWYCKPCKAIRSAEERRRNPEKVRAYMRVYTLKKYGMTVESFDALLESQGGGCAICGGIPTKMHGREVFHVDHCHDGGEVRGLLCGLCNQGLGQFHDDPELLRAAASYLERARAVACDP